MRNRSPGLRANSDPQSHSRCNSHGGHKPAPAPMTPAWLHLLRAAEDAWNRSFRFPRLGCGSRCHSHRWHLGSRHLRLAGWQRRCAGICCGQGLLAARALRKMPLALCCLGVVERAFQVSGEEVRSGAVTAPRRKAFSQRAREQLLESLFLVAGVHCCPLPSLERNALGFLQNPAPARQLSFDFGPCSRSLVTAGCPRLSVPSGTLRARDISNGHSSMAYSKLR